MQDTKKMIWAGIAVVTAVIIFCLGLWASGLFGKKTPEPAVLNPTFSGGTGDIPSISMIKPEELGMVITPVEGTRGDYRLTFRPDPKFEQAFNASRLYYALDDNSFKAALNTRAVYARGHRKAERLRVKLKNFSGEEVGPFEFDVQKGIAQKPDKPEKGEFLEIGGTRSEYSFFGRTLIKCDIHPDSRLNGRLKAVHVGYERDTLNAVFNFTDPSKSRNLIYAGDGMVTYGYQFFLPIQQGQHKLYCRYEHLDGSLSKVLQMTLKDGRTVEGNAVLMTGEPGAPAVSAAWEPRKEHYDIWEIIPMVNSSVYEKVGWGPDEQGFIPLKKSTVPGFSATIRASNLGLDKYEVPYDTKPVPLYFEFVKTNGERNVHRYEVDLWRLSREALKELIEPGSVLKVRGGGNVYFKRIHAKQTPLGFLFQKIWWGVQPDKLNDLDDFDFKQDERDYKASLPPEKARRYSGYSLDFSKPWRKSFNNEIFGVKEETGSVFVKFKYWDGEETEVIRILLQ